MEDSESIIPRFDWTKQLNPVVAQFDLSVPIIVGPMAPSKGGPSTPSFVAASCNSGALGVLASAYSSPEQMKSDIMEIKKLTSRPFGINLFAPIPMPDINETQLESARVALEPIRKLLKLPLNPPLEPPFLPNFDDQFEVVLSSKPALFSWGFGLIDGYYVKECARHGIKTAASCTTVEEGLQLEALGVDYLVAQGYEAGGHRPTFDANDEDANISTRDLVIGLKEAGVKVPIIASGGIMNGGEIRKCLSLSASAVQMGTAFLLCKEAGTSSTYRRILQQQPTAPLPTTLTRAFSGRPARALVNKFIAEMEGRDVLPFPAQSVFTRDIRSESNSQDSGDYLALWAGVGVGQIMAGLCVGELIQILKKELEQAN